MFKRMAIKTGENPAKGFGFASDSSSKLGCDVPSTHPPIHLCSDAAWVYDWANDDSRD